MFNFFFVIRNPDFDSNKTTEPSKNNISANDNITNLIANTNNIPILKILVNAKIKPEFTPSFTNKFQSYVSDFRENYLNEVLQKSNSEIQCFYKTKVNSLNVFFKEQLLDINLVDVAENDNFYTKIDDEFFYNIIDDIDVFLLELEYKNKSLDEFKIIITPDKFTDIIDKSLETAMNIHVTIEKNYDKIVEKDKTLLEEKNKILMTRNIFNFAEIIQLIKDREKINYILVDIDIEITNCLIELNNIRYYKLKNDELLNTLTLLKTIFIKTNSLEKEFNKYMKCFNLN